MDRDEAVKTWAQGLVLFNLMLAITLIFGALGVSMTYTALATILSSAAALFTLLIAFAVLPWLFGIVSFYLTDLFFGESSDAGALMTWIHGVSLTLMLMIATTVFAFFGLSLALLAEGVTGGSLILGLLAFVVLPLLYGWISRTLSENLG